MECGLVCCGSEYELLAGCCEWVNKIAGSIKCRNFLTSWAPVGCSTKLVTYCTAVIIRSAGENAWTFARVCCRKEVRGIVIKTDCSITNQAELRDNLAVEIQGKPFAVEHESPLTYLVREKSRNVSGSCRDNWLQRLLENKSARLWLSRKEQPRAVNRGGPTKRPSQSSTLLFEVVFAVASAVWFSFSGSLSTNVWRICREWLQAMSFRY